MARPSDVGANPDGSTIVRGVDSLGQPVSGVLNEDAEYFTARWSVRARQMEGEGCPTWLKNVVISKTQAGAMLGAGLAGDDEVPPSSSQCSQHVVAIEVDDAGVELNRRIVPHSLVHAVFPAAGVGTEPMIAAELWFSNEPFDSNATNVAAAVEYCNAALGRRIVPQALAVTAHERDVLPAPDGTEVIEVDGSGNVLANGRLKGKTFVTTAWAFQKRARPEGCPLWLTKIVVSETVAGARNGAALATLPGGEDPGSSFVSRDMEIIVVDADGAQVNSFIAKYGVVTSVFARTIGTTTPPVAATLWFSDSPIDESLPKVKAAKSICDGMPPLP
jgi:hypothetical protein